MTKTTQTPTQNVALVAGLMIVLGIVSIYFYFLPQLVTQRTTLESDKAQLAGLQQSKATLLNAQKRLDSAEAELTQKGVNFAKLPSVYPPNEDMPGLYVQLENLVTQASTNNNVVASYQVSAPVADPAGGGKIPITFSATGSLSDLETFIVSLEQNTRPIILSQISVSTSATNANSGVLTMTANGLTRIAQVSSAYTTSK